MADAPIFVDTNVFAYALDDAEAAKRDRAREVIDVHRRLLVVSTQVLIELHAVCTRKLGLSRVDAGRAVREIAAFPVVHADRELVLDAAALADAQQISIFDAAVVAAAARAGCEEILTEDLASGQRIAGVAVRNPFA